MAEREWRDPADLEPSRAGFLAVLAAAAALRFWKLGYVVPHAAGSEEPEIVERAFEMMKAGTLNPQFFDYGALSIVLQLGVSIVRFVLGSMGGDWYSLAQATSHPFYSWGRGLVACLGVLTVLLVFRIGMRWGARHALLGAALVAVLPVHVQYSQVVTPDILLTFLGTLTLMLSLAGSERRSALTFGAAGFSAGLAIATRYSGALMLVMPILACLLTNNTRPSRTAGVLWILVATVAGFVLGAPYTIVDLPLFLERFGALAASARAEAVPGAVMQVVALQFGSSRILQTLSLCAWTLAAVGIVVTSLRMLRGPNRVPAAVAISFLVVQTAFTAWLGSPDPRTLLPAMPVLSLLMAVGVFATLSLVRAYEFGRVVRRGLAVSLSALALAPGTIASVQYIRERAKPSTNDVAYIPRPPGPDVGNLQIIP